MGSLAEVGAGVEAGVEGEDVGVGVGGEAVVGARKVLAGVGAGVASATESSP